MSPLVIAAFVVAIAVEVGAPIAAGFWVEAHLDVPWRLFFYGAMVFAAAELALRVPLLNLLGPRLSATAESGLPAVLGWSAVVAGSAALLETVGRYLGFRYLFRDQRRTWNSAVMYGLGHGGLESIFLVGMPTLVTFLNALTIPGMDPVALGLSAEQAERLRLAQVEIARLGPLIPLSAALERLLALALQVALSVLVVQVFLRASRRWLVYAFAIQFGVGLIMGLLFTYSRISLALGFLAVAVAVAGYWALTLRPAPVPVAPARSRKTRS